MAETRKRVQSWEVTDDLWAMAAPLIPERKRSRKKKYERKAGGGRKPLEPRLVFEGIVFVLRTGIQWKALPKTFGASSSVHKYFQEWRKPSVAHVREASAGFERQQRFIELVTPKDR